MSETGERASSRVAPGRGWPAWRRCVRGRASACGRGRFREAARRGTLSGLRVPTALGESFANSLGAIHCETYWYTKDVHWGNTGNSVAPRPSPGSANASSVAEDPSSPRVPSAPPSSAPAEEGGDSRGPSPTSIGCVARIRQPPQGCHRPILQLTLSPAQCVCFCKRILLGIPQPLHPWGLP